MLLKRSQENDIEIPYNCGGVLANILSDGLEAWTISSSIDQSIVNEEMYEAVQTWDLRKQRTINYRSLAPILRLLDERFPTGCIMWAVWAMTNLTTVLRMYRSSLFSSDRSTLFSLVSVILAEKYCTLVRNENGEPLLTQILDSENMTEPIRQLAEAALANVQR